MSASFLNFEPQSRQAGTPAATIIRRSHRPLCRATARTSAPAKAGGRSLERQQALTGHAGFVPANNRACPWDRAKVSRFARSGFVGPSLATCLVWIQIKVIASRYAPALENGRIRPPQAAALERKYRSRIGDLFPTNSLPPPSSNSPSTDYNIASFFALLYS